MPTEILTVSSSKFPVRVSKTEPFSAPSSDCRNSLSEHTALSGMGRVPSHAGSLLDLAFMHVAGYFQNSSQAQGLGLAEVNAPWTSGVSQAD